MRWLGIIPDPIAGGTRLEDVLDDPAALLQATDFLPVEGSNVTPGERALERGNDVRNRRAESPPPSFAAAPSLNFTSKAWTRLTPTVLRRAMGGAIALSGVAPAAIQSTVQMAQSGALPALQATLVREEQVDRVTGVWLDEVTFNFPADGEGTIEVTGPALYHDVAAVEDVPGLPNPQGMPNYVDAYMLRDATAIMGDGTGVPIDCLGGFGFTINNNLSDDFRTRFCAGLNVLEVDVDGELHKLWYPNRNKLGGAQTITGRLDYGNNRPDRELRRLVRHAEKLVVELAGAPLGTTPAADEMVRLTFYKQAPTGGGAEALAREGDQQSSYEFTAYLDDTVGKDLEATVIGTAALV